ncbi:acyl carrier protein [Pelosinus baikalensis]|uniref:Acyl carrier protein n=1 Tax=Pelosinus baikalensis TaxID=2892015 RepID=A0ABS8HTI4_9FIRM|nr:acyl carrier protein [Pelosinus baikalensis]
MNIDNEVRKIVAQIIEVDESVLDPDASFMEDLGIDSLRALEILAAVENQYSITIEPERLREMTTLNKVIAITKEYLD